MMKYRSDCVNVASSDVVDSAIGKGLVVIN